jgi:molybdopterin/thiamine biosynthesis adenylyltransferase
MSSNKTSSNKKGMAFLALAIGVILNLGEQLIGKLMTVDALDLNFRTLQINKDKHCPICNYSNKFQK